MSGLVDIFLDDIKAKKAVLYLVAILFIFISGSRWETGTDWMSYYSFFTYNFTFKDFVFNNSGFEIGYKLLNSFVKAVTDKYTILLLFLAMLSIIPKTVAFARYKYFLVIFFGYFAVFEADMFAVRQHAAIAFAVLSYTSIINRNFGRFLACILIGMVFHWTIIGFIPAYFIFNSTKLGKFSLLIVCGTLLGYLVHIQELLFRFALNRFANIDADSKLGSQILLYSQNTSDLDRLSMLGMIARLTIIIFMFILKNKKKDDKIINGFTNMYVVGFAIYVILGSTAIVFVRLSWYYNFAEVILLAYSLTIFKTRYDRLLVYLIFSLYFGLRIYQNISGQAYLKQPIYFFWEKSERNNLGAPL